MGWVIDIIVILVLIASFFGGFKEGAVKQFFQLVILFIAVPLTGVSYQLLAAVLSFLPGANWENFIGFFITLAIITVILNLILLLPRKIVQKLWKKGVFFRLLGAAMSVFGAIVGMVVFALVLMTYPIFGWLLDWVTSSSVLMSLVESFGFVRLMLPEIFRQVSTTVRITPAVAGRV